MKRLFYTCVVCCTLLLAGCISNDIPYPRIQANFLSLNAVGQSGSAHIDSTSRVVTLTFPEDVNLYEVEISDYTLTPGATLVGTLFESAVNLTQPKYTILRLYQDYQWKIVADQPVERYFEVVGQIGSTVIDVAARRVVVSVREGVDVSNLEVVRAKLANVGSTMRPDISEGGVVDASHPLTILVDVWDYSQEWAIYVNVVEATVTTTSVDAWTGVAWVYGDAEAGKDNGFEYRLAGTEDWIKVDSEDITHNGGSFTGRINHLSAETTYEVRAYSDEDYGEVLTFTTGTTAQMPNSNFDQWWLDGKVWCPWAEGDTPYWGTGNVGATTLGSSNSVPTEDTPSGTGYAAMLETRFVGIGTLGKLAAGNLFVGDYVRTDGTNGVLAFGRSFTERPARLRGKMKYVGANITHASDNFKSSIGQPDTAVVWCALIDTSEPYEIRTNPKNQQLFDPQGSYVVGYGRMQWSESVSEWTTFEFDIEYTSTSRVPKYILCTASASKYGDYFTGGNGSILYVDDFELLYDY